MSAIFDELEKIDAKKGMATPLWPVETRGEAELFPSNLPEEVLADFYDLREYIRIAGQRSQMHVISITSSLSGEGSSTIATALAFLLANGGENKMAVDAAMTSGDFATSSRERALRRGVDPAQPGAESIFQTEFTDYIQKEAAEALLQTIKRGGILLVDANLYSPGLHRFFGLDRDEGLAEIIEEQQDWRKLTRCMHDSDLHVITAGSAKGKPADLTGSSRFQELIKAWRAEFRYVIIDSPAVLDHVDALSLSALSDGVILVVRAGQTRWEVAQNAKRKLSVAQANLLGVALNRQKNIVPDGALNRLI